MEYFKSTITLAFSILLSLILAEFFLFTIGKYSNLINTDFQNSNTIWENKPFKVESVSHPDLGITVYSNYDEKGIRENIDFQSNTAEFFIGFFGDSFLANRNIEYKYTISSLFNEFINLNKVLNFGVDGFGLEQSYQRWKNNNNILFSDVVYFFTDNDITDLERVNLFTIISDNDNFQLINNYEENNYSNDDLTFKQIIGKFRITYLFIDSYYQIRAFYFLLKKKLISDIKKSTISNYQPYQGELSARFINKDLSAHDQELIKKFNIILNRWKTEVEEMGNTFHLAILPRDWDLQLLPIILKNNPNQFNIIYLSGPKDIETMKEFKFAFKNDGHWNEIGNLAAFSSIVDYFNLNSKYVNRDDFFSNKLEDILSYYKNYKSTPNK